MASLWILAFVGVGLSAWSVLSTCRMLYPIPRPFSPPSRFPSYRTATLLQDDAPLECWIFEAASPRGLLVACHGYHMNRWQLLDVADGLRQRGYTVVLFDLRGHGSRAQQPCTFGLRDRADIGHLLRWIGDQPALAALPLGFFGWSLGGAVVCQAAAQFTQCRAIVVDSMYARLFPILAQTIRRQYHLPSMPWAWLTWWSAQVVLWTRLAPGDPLRMAARCVQPVFVIHGTADQSVPVAHAEMIAVRWRGPSERWLVDGAGHVGSAAQDLNRYCDRVADFFHRWLVPAAA